MAVAHVSLIQKQCDRMVVLQNMRDNRISSIVARFLRLQCFDWAIALAVVMGIQPRQDKTHQTSGPKATSLFMDNSLT
jgi:hypothetical protein